MSTLTSGLPVNMLLLDVGGKITQSLIGELVGHVIADLMGELVTMNSNSILSRHTERLTQTSKVVATTDALGF